MGQKVNPIGLRLGINKTWLSRWYQKKGYADTMLEDFKLRETIEKLLVNAEVEKVEIIRYPERINVNIHTARPGIVIGKKGADVEKLKNKLQKLTTKKLHLNIVEIKKPEASATLIAKNIAKQLEGKVSHKRAMKQAIQNATGKGGVSGIKILVSGRLGGAEMARKESYKEGRIPLHTLRADIDYGIATAITQMGTIGVKVWVFKGEILNKEDAMPDDSLLLNKKRGKKERG
ncbi:MAG: 30S ribosomal protein S3 [Spirochaetota bacterium]